MAHKLIPIHKLTLKEMIRNTSEYGSLSDGLCQLPVPDQLRIGKKYYPVPADMDQFTKSLCYGQRLFFNTEEENDYGVIIRMIDGYYYSIVTGKKWDQDKALLFGKIIIPCTVVELYPVAFHLVKLFGEMIEREHKLLYHAPSKMEIAAGIEKLNIFSELSALDFLRDSMKIPVAEVLLTPYNECLVRFMLAKETEDFKTRYIELQNEEYKSKSQKK